MAKSTPKTTLSIDELIAAKLRIIGDGFAKDAHAQRRGGLPPGTGNSDEFFEAAAKRASELADMLEGTDE